MYYVQSICRKSLRFLVAIVASAGLFSSQSSAQYSPLSPPPADLQQGFDSINVEQSQEWLGILAGPKFEGRGTGQPGFIKAAHWVAGKLAEFGLEPMGDNGTYFQMLPMKRRLPVLEECYVTGPGDLRIEAKGNMGFDRFTDQQEITGDVVFVNFSGENTQLAEDVQLRDKIVVYVDDEKAASSAPFQLARQRPLAAIRVISGRPVSSPQLVREGGRTRSTSVSGTMTQEAARKLVEGLGGKADWLNKPEKESVEIHDTFSPAGAESPISQQITLRMRFQEELAAAPNVIAWLEGSDPNLKHEYVVIGSHLDHLGNSRGQVYPGADDNGSGSTAVLNIAKAFATNSTRPKRSVLFIWFAAEEMGLVGSRHYCNNPTKPLEDMMCMFNIDMVGRNEESKDETSEENEGHIHLVGSQKGDNDIHEIVLKANESVGFEFELDQEGVWNRSDQINFYNAAHVPVSFLFDGFHPDYHKPSDQIEKINFKKLVSAAKLYYLAVNLAAEHGRFKPNPENEK